MNALFEEFAESNAEAWKERLTKDLKGITFEDLSVIDRNGINIHPFYTADDECQNTQAVFAHKDWIICAAINVNDEKTANKQALNELQNGGAGLCFQLQDDTNLSILLAEIELQYIYTQFNVTGNTLKFLSAFNDFLALRNLNADDLDYIINVDPINELLVHGSLNKTEAQQNFYQQFDATKSIPVLANIYQNAGANSAYQLACCTAQINEYLYWLDVSGRLAQLKTIYISFTSGTDFFEEIAKLRALNSLLETLLSTYSIKPKIHLHIETSDTYRSAFDSYSNLLRDTIAGMAAVLGGCHSLLIHPFDQNLNEAGEFSSRMSRNQQLILKEESYLHQIADASAGSFYLENLSSQIAEKAWVYFKEIEANNGLVASFEMIKTSVKMQAEQWIQEYKEGKRILIGVNKYVNANDPPKAAAERNDGGKGLKTISLTEELMFTNE